MPNRILKESICISESIEHLTWFEEVLFYRLVVSCDDYGRYDGRPAIIKNRLFPLKEDLDISEVVTGLHHLAKYGLITLYEHNGKPYLFLPAWESHQTIRAKKSKFPSPNEGLITHEIICNQMQADVPVIQSNPIQSESNPNPNQTIFLSPYMEDTESEDVENPSSGWLEETMPKEWFG